MKKILISALFAALILTFAVNADGNVTNTAVEVNENVENVTNTDTQENLEQVPAIEQTNAYFVSKTASVLKVDGSLIECSTHGNDEVDLVLDIHDMTPILDNTGKKISLSDIKEGQTVTAYDYPDSVRLMVYPETYSPVVLVVTTDEQTQFAVDTFTLSSDEGREDMYLSSDGKLALSISQETTITHLTDKTSSDNIAQKVILVAYQKSTRGIPPVALAQNITVISDVRKAPFNPEAYLNDSFVTDNGTLMLPLRKVLEDNGFDIQWDDETKTVHINSGFFSVKIGSDKYAVGRAMPTTLEEAAVIRNGLTYVPASYFTQIVGL